MKLLLITSEPISAQQLREAVEDSVDVQDAEVMVVAPALQESPIKFWFSDADEAIARADAVRQQSVKQLDADGVRASGDVGEADPLEAIQDALQTFAADRIVLFTKPGSPRYREDLDAGEIEERFGLPVEHARVTGV